MSPRVCYSNPGRFFMVIFNILETNRLILKGLSPESMRYIFEKLPKPEIKQLLGHRSEEDYLQEEYKHLHGYASYNRRFLLFLLEEKSTGEIIGRCGIHNWNAEHRRAEIGYIMGEERNKQKGYMTEALGAILHFGFESLQLNRVEAIVAVDNVPSLKLMDKYGFVQEGVLRQHQYSAGAFVDAFLFSKLRTEN